MATKKSTKGTASAKAIKKVEEAATSPTPSGPDDVNASAPKGEANPALPDEKPDETTEAVDLKEAAETYTRTYRIPSVKPDSTELPAGFNDQAYAEATVREAIQHGWRVENGVVAKRVSVKKVEGSPESIDVSYRVNVFAAAGAPAGAPVGQTFDDVADTETAK